eukprot:CAMPEP_0202848440 /NCGR_PEP_ID=MMETSP1389-20130828/78136_1 /ASSEMBLY_ACC=CAM_ASM_000865 /TAXON_ID=302021 /ORGANISM="Rhodomonas sp., Strain CCMP768" /LENGTH=43 /DNA_ID= /DNA_START= /DNA_END= /DNA_ORIENTATION=
MTPPSLGQPDTEPLSFELAHPHQQSTPSRPHPTLSSFSSPPPS